MNIFNVSCSNKTLVISQGEYYNADEVQAMVAAEVLEEERKKKLEAEATEAALRSDIHF